jgi:hypothetical protein
MLQYLAIFVSRKDREDFEEVCGKLRGAYSFAYRLDDPCGAHVIRAY